ncbi:hypothetical protein BJ085DRAFT_30438 [Dimargaris cristalligena]|uniref:Glycosyl transferase family 25 domain-containing protein n=1 Tax=Dimargaris cristalligena TaxID=215637 RepID=A0A4P9ZLV5_9FUNG|nr:hypothetical protein BJ085DRAFT_30438 [Dimargaris cristalligena]|eukprot:RKP34088.1 hypothetical protein BJ085DRAFT_30438 [Dimargaris cristalligena]
MTILSYHLNVFVREYDPPPRGTVLRPTLESYQEGYGGPATLPTTRLGFDKVFLINLERRTDHLARMRQLADFMHLNMTVFPATDKLTLDRSKFPPGSEGMGDSYLACWDSHMRVYQEVVDNPAIETALILEDDIDFDWNIEAKVARARAAIGDRPWDAFFIGHCGSSVGNLLYAVDLKANLYRGDTSACTHGYAVSKQGARKLLKGISPPNHPIDVMIIEMEERHEIDIYSIRPSLIRQVHFRGDRSDINSDGGFSTGGREVKQSVEEMMYKMRLAS